MRTLNDLTQIVVDQSFRLHCDLGPGLLESVYEQVLAAKLQKPGLSVVRQRAIDIEYDDIKFEGAFRADLIVEERLLIEIKSTERLVPVHAKQVVTYLRLMDLPLGLLINFGGATFKDNVRRIASGRHPLSAFVSW